MLNNPKVNRIVLRFHGTFLILLTILLIGLSSLGTFRGTGVFDWLHSNPMADVGLFQAYSLMMLVGVVLWIGSYQEQLWIWDLIGLCAHIAPLLANFIFADVLAKTGLPSTIPLH